MNRKHFFGNSTKWAYVVIGMLAMCLMGSNVFATRMGKFETIEVAFDAPDSSVELVGYLSLPPAYKKLVGLPPLVVLLHQQNESSAAWQVFVEELAQTGHAVFAMDLRGYGLSTFDLRANKVRPKNTFYVDEQLNFPDDVAFLVGKAIATHGDKFDTTRVAVVGADIGGSAGLIWAQHDKRVKYICLISPAMEYEGLRIMPILREFDSRPILFATADKDIYSVESIDLIEDLLPREVDVLVVESMFHGNRLVSTSIPIRARIIQDLAKYLDVVPEKTK